MTCKKWTIQQLWLAHEVNFGVDPDVTGALYKFVKTVGDVTFEPSAEVVERPGNTGTMTRQPHVIGVKTGKISGKLEMKGSGTPAVAGVPAIASESSPLIEACLGNVFRGTGTTVAAGSTDTIINVAVGTGVNLRKGMFLHFATGGLGELAFVKSVVGDVVTLDSALAAPPALAVVITASSVFTRTDSGHKTMAFVGTRDGVQFTFLGCPVKVKLDSITARGTAMLSFEADVADWSRTAKGALPASLVLAGINAVKAPVVKAGIFMVDGVQRHIRAIEFDPGQEFTWQETAVTADTAKACAASVGSNPKGTFKPYYADENLDDFISGAEQSIAFGVGSTTNGWGIYAGKAQYTEVKPENAGGLYGESVPFACNDDGADAEYIISQF